MGDLGSGGRNIGRDLRLGDLEIGEQELALKSLVFPPHGSVVSGLGSCSPLLDLLEHRSLYTLVRDLPLHTRLSPSDLTPLSSLVPHNARDE